MNDFLNFLWSEFRKDVIVAAVTETLVDRFMILDVVDRMFLVDVGHLPGRL